MGKVNKKSGIKTTQFWLTVLTIVGYNLLLLRDLIPAEYAAILIFLSTVSYSIAREFGYVKFYQNKDKKEEV